MSGVRCPPPLVSCVRCPPLEPFERRKIAPATGFGTLFEHQKTFAHTPLPRGFRDMFRYVLERSFDDSFTIFTIFEKWAFMILSDFLDIRKNTTHFFHTFPQEHGRMPPQTRPKLSSICTGLCKAAFEMLTTIRKIYELYLNPIKEACFSFRDRVYLH